MGEKNLGGDFYKILQITPPPLRVGWVSEITTPTKRINKLINQPNFQVWLVLLSACPNC